MQNQKFIPIFLFKENVIKSLDDIDIYINNKKEKYINEPCEFDIETTSYYNKDEQKRATMYIWMFGFNDIYTYGRTWEEFTTLLQWMKNTLAQKDLKTIIYVHNLAYEFQFMRKWLKIDKLFAIKERKPIYFQTDNIEFRCSYLLSGLSLENIGKQIGTEKQTGKLDYNKPRHHKTPLTISEFLYCFYDLKVIHDYIKQEKKRFHAIPLIPITKTGKVRKHIKQCCFYGADKKTKGKQYNIYRTKIKGLTLTEEVYTLLKLAFMGGFTHSSLMNTNKIFKNVFSFDLTSAYPAVMFREKFPVTPPKKRTVKDKKTMLYYLKNKCCLFNVRFENIQPKIHYDYIISTSKCRDVQGIEESNGRLIRAKSVTMTITEQDFKAIKTFYEWSDMYISDFYTFEKGYLPKEFIIAMLELYKEKTELKGVSGKEDYYLNVKEMLNSMYGMTVTDIAQPLNCYNDETNEWYQEPTDIEKAINKYNSNSMRFLYYAWGIWVTAYVRLQIFDAIIELGNDYIYSDTDSVKFINGEKHIEYFNNINKYIIECNKNVCDIRNIDYSLCEPETIKGEKKPLGVFEQEHTMQLFKTCGAKRYMTMIDYNLSFTVSGCNKKNAIPYLISTYGKYKAFEMFNDKMYIPSNYTGKMTHTYIDDEFTDVFTDYNGVSTTIHEKSFIHLEPCEFEMGISPKFLALMMKGIEIINE